MGLDETHFDVVAGHLVGTLRDAGLGDEEVDEAMAVVGPLRVAFERRPEDK
jgi:hypothetical protein